MLARWIDGAIIALALALLCGFLAILFRYEDQPARLQPSPPEMLAVVPTSSKASQQPVTRSFDQIKGVMEGLTDVADRVAMVVRAEYIPQVDDPVRDTASAAAQVHAETRVLIAPGTSKDTRDIFVDGCAKAPRPCEKFAKLPLLLVSSTSTSLRTTERVRVKALIPAVQDDENIAATIANAIVALGLHVDFDFNYDDKFYSAELGPRIRDLVEAHGRADLVQADLFALLQPSTRVIVGNDTWWQLQGSRLGGHIVNIILGDGLNDRATLDSVHNVFGGAKMFCVMADTHRGLELVGGHNWKHENNAQFTWNHVARYSSQRIALGEAVEPLAFKVAECEPKEPE